MPVLGVESLSLPRHTQGNVELEDVTAIPPLKNSLRKAVVVSLLLFFTLSFFIP